jgi:hypothetical protein
MFCWPLSLLPFIRKIREIPANDRRNDEEAEGFPMTYVENDGE